MVGRLPQTWVEMLDLIILTEAEGSLAWLIPSWGNVPWPVSGEEESIITLLSQPGSLATLIGTCNGLLMQSNLGRPVHWGLWGGGMTWGRGLSNDIAKENWECG